MSGDDPSEVESNKRRIVDELLAQQPGDAQLFAHIENRNKRNFLIVYSWIGQIGKACAACGITRCTPWSWKQTDAEFAMAMNEAEKLLASRIAEKAVKQIFKGLNGGGRLKFNKDGDAMIDPRTGELYVEYDRPDSLIMFLLKKFDPGKFGDSVGGPTSPQTIRVIWDDEAPKQPSDDDDANDDTELSSGPAGDSLNSPDATAKENP